MTPFSALEQEVIRSLPTASRTGRTTLSRSESNLRLALVALYNLDADFDGSGGTIHQCTGGHIGIQRRLAVLRPVRMNP